MAIQHNIKIGEKKGVYNKLIFSNSLKQIKSNFEA